MNSLGELPDSVLAAISDRLRIVGLCGDRGADDLADPGDVGKRSVLVDAFNGFLDPFGRAHVGRIDMQPVVDGLLGDHEGVAERVVFLPERDWGHLPSSALFRFRKSAAR
jgi:hypothetical protein